MEMKKPIYEKPLVSQEHLSEVFAKKDKRNHRAMCISYAKDLVVSHQLSKEEMYSEAEKMLEFIYK